jgi:DNA-binding MarR family transcriptional regulator
MSTVSDPIDVTPDVVANDVVGFIQAFEGWVRRRAQESGGSPPRLRLLYALHCEGPRKMADLAEDLGVTPRNVTALVDALEAEGTVRRTAHPTDRRITMIELIDQPATLTDQIEAFNGAIGALFGRLRLRTVARRLRRDSREATPRSAPLSRDPRRCCSRSAPRSRAGRGRGTQGRGPTSSSSRSSASG